MKPQGPPTLISTTLYYPELIALSEQKSFPLPSFGMIAQKPLNKNLIYAPAKVDSRYKQNKQRQHLILESGLTFSCHRGYHAGGCPNGHMYLKAIFCGKEYCTECGCDGSAIHQRRIERWKDRVMSFDNLGQFVITFTPLACEWFKAEKTTDRLTQFRSAIKRYLKRELGYNKGLQRWHYAGDCASCKGNGCEKCLNTGTNKEWRPHLNIFVEQGNIKKNSLEWKTKVVGLRDFTAKWILNNAKIQMEGNVNFKFSNTEAGKFHKLKYVTRSTFRHYNEQQAEMLHGYRCASRWGLFEKPTGECNTDLHLLEKGLCTCCKHDTGEVVNIKWDVGYYCCKDCGTIYNNKAELKNKHHPGKDCSCENVKYHRKILDKKFIPRDGKMLHIAAGYYTVVPHEFEMVFRLSGSEQMKINLN
jgi:hypothetical protein